MGSVILNHVQSDQLDSKMLGGFNADVYSRAPQLERTRSRSTSTNATPTSTVPPPLGSSRLPAQPSDVPAYINSTSSNSTPSHPPSMTSQHAYPSDNPSHSNTHTPQYSHGNAPAESMTAPQYAQASPDSPRLHPTYPSMQSVPGSLANSPSRIHVKSLSHIQSLASEEWLAPRRTHVPGQQRHFEISSMPVGDIIEMVAGLLTKITTTNDLQHEHNHRNIPLPEASNNLSPQATSVLAFHGKNVPSITILSYLTRIHKYCPTTYEVFLSLLVYFDRMTELVNQFKYRGQTPSLDHSDLSYEAFESPAGRPTHDSSMVTPPSSAGMTAQVPKSPNSSISPSLYPHGEDDHLSQFFVVDSFNIHRLVIAGVTCASKFFSDVFYTNSRYAKVCYHAFYSFLTHFLYSFTGMQVGGLPLAELNHLELQFLMLNDFRLAISVEELEAYGTRLVEFYAREMVVQQHVSVPRAINSSEFDSAPDAMYMRSRDKRRDNPEVGQTPTPP
ncbi:hypothetical protein N7495_002775 [Penicillium taxi]|uniref:uncharacterized protein n=1 Tax=Penicillium taxi TaxID=168475 RepID=UPI0025456772|nr:uncharacterized protein N7495_002775 [Penicillium taxi]KAJ5902247.1 hypothetical protein N7495_002775 [Penicillium taxi]